MSQSSLRAFVLLLFLCGGSWGVASENPPALNLIGKQSQNEGLPVVRLSVPPKIDGDLGEWNEKSRIWCFPDFDMREKYSVEVMAGWDDDALYLALRWKDPDGLHNEVDPAVEPNSGWRADAVQLRVATPDQTTSLTAWMFTPSKQPVLLVETWNDRKNSRAGQNSKLLVAPSGGTELGEGVEMAYRNAPEAGGFTQEIRIPWKLIYQNPPHFSAGDKFSMGLEFIWGGPDGRTKSAARYADNMQRGMTTREFFWTASNIWGDATLVDAPPTEARQYRLAVASAEKTAGVPIEFVAPDGAAAITVVIEDESGKRVRNLVADRPISPGRVEVAWNGLDDEGKPVAPGRYKARGLTRGQLKVSYEGCFYNPGTPPWATADGTGGWGADHTNPAAVATDEKATFLGWGYAEGGFGTISLNSDGRKVWSQRTGASFLALTAQDVLGALEDIHGDANGPSTQLSRFNRETGKGRPFLRDGQPLPFPAPLSLLLGNDARGKVVGLAVHGGRIFVALSEGKLFELSEEEATLVRTYELPGVEALASHPQLGLLGIVDHKLCRIEAGKAQAVEFPDLKNPGALAVRADGLLAVWDRDASQVRFGRFDDGGKKILPAGFAGKTGGRPIRGVFDPGGLLYVAAIGFGPKGNLWVAENWLFPRRISVWNDRGQLVDSYVGNAAYSGSGSFLDPENPDIGYVGPVQMRRDASGNWAVDRILWVPDRAKGECFEWTYRNYGIPYLYRPKSDPKKRRWIFYASWRPFQPRVFFVEDGDAFKPAAAIALAGHVSGKLNDRGLVERQPEGEFAGLNAYDLLFWCDENGDGKVQRSECQVAPAERPAEIGKIGKAAYPLSVGWAGRPDVSDFSFVAVDGKKTIQFQPESFSKSGYPRFSPKSIRSFDWPVNGELVPLADGKTALLLDTKDEKKRAPHVAAINRQDGSLLWSYPNPYPGVHGSHEATMDRPGLVIGPLFIAGVAENEKHEGYFLLRGNSGQDFLFTLDGLMVGSLFQDARHPGASFLPTSEAELKGKNLLDFTNGFEPFSGWFGRQNDGKIRLTMTTAGQAVMVGSLDGLDSVRALSPIDVTLAKDVLEASARSETATVAPTGPKAAIITKVAKPLDLNLASDWAKLPALVIEREGAAEKAEVRLAHDGKSLFAEFDVLDSSPWRNHGSDYRTLFKAGDCVDILFGPPGDRRQPEEKDTRLLISSLEGKPVAVVMRPVATGAKDSEHFVYESPVGRKAFDSVRLAPEVPVTVEKSEKGYVVRLAIPLDLLGVSAMAEGNWKADFGIIVSDQEGTKNVARRYWNNQKTNLESDLPSEAWFSPATTGEVTFGK